MHRHLARLLVLALFAALLPAMNCGEGVAMPGLSAPVSVDTDKDGVRHLIAENDLDLARAQGWVHARDRLFQMDLTRREASGDLSEVLGNSTLGSDIQNRTVGLRRAAARTADNLTPEEEGLLQAYADGVNHFIATRPLPPEYAMLELTSVRPWDIVDSLVIGKAISASLSLDIDIGLTLSLQAFIEAGIAGGFDGQALFSEDVVRSAPMDPASTVPDATGGVPFLAKASKLDEELIARAAARAENVKEKLSQSRLLAQAMSRRTTHVGSNEWGVAGAHAENGLPIIANDPHLSLNIPSTFYEWHLISKNDPDLGPMNVNGVGFAGTPGVILGQNEHVTWGATTNPMDVSDTFLDELHVLQPDCFLIGAFACIRSEGVFHGVDIEFATYFTNVIGDNVDDNLVEVPLPPEQTIIATVPFRSFGPVLDITDPGVISGGGVTTALILQYTGFHATREILSFLKWNRAESLADFVDGLADFDVGSQNWAYADADGNLAYFSSAELPLRKDLETGTVDGLPPYFIRDGSGPNNWKPDPAHSQGQAIPYEILPAAEMPQTINPANGFFVNANNDPAGTTLDNDPLNQMRTGNPSAIYYLNPGYADGLRAGRITRLVQGKIDEGEAISANDMKRFQANTQMLDAELVSPFLLTAFGNADAPGAPPALADMAEDPDVAEAIGRLGQWDYSSPTGIPEGYDAHDNDGMRTPSVPVNEAESSIASTIWNAWRGHAIAVVIDTRLAAIGAPSVGSRDAYKALHHLLSQSPYTGVGASGVDFIPEPAGLTAEERRDLALLTALRSALDDLASNDYADAFGNSTDQDDYRWGRLHRIVFDHPFEASFSIPPAAGFDHLAPSLPGLSRDGGYEVVNASGFSARAGSQNSYRFGGGPVRRYVGEAGIDDSGDARVRGFNVMPGGPSGVPGDPGYATQLGSWLTADYHSVNMKDRIPASGPEKLTLIPVD